MQHLKNSFGGHCQRLKVVGFVSFCLLHACAAQSPETHSDIRTTQAPVAVEVLLEQAKELRAEGALGEAQEVLASAETRALNLDQSYWLPLVYNEQAVLQTRSGHWFSAARLFERSALTVSRNKTPLITAQAFANAAQALTHTEHLEKARAYINKSVEALNQVSDSKARRQLFLNLAHTGLLVVEKAPTLVPQLMPRITYLIERGMNVPGEGEANLNNVYGLAYLGKMELMRGGLRKAQHATEQALFINQQIPTGESSQAAWFLYTQLASIQSKAGQSPAAIESYKSAIRHLNILRPQLLQQDFESPFLGAGVPGDIYRSLLDLLLQSAATTNDQIGRESLLRQARNYAEQMKAAEIRDYFRDDCVDTLQAKLRHVAEVAADTAVIYPIVLEDRLELLMEHPEQGLLQRSVDVEHLALSRTLQAYREELEAKSIDFRGHAEQLYQWLIDPLKSELGASISTLVFVPGGELASVPLATLVDGNGRFLVDRFALAVTPGIELVDPTSLDRGGLRPLYAGLSVETGDFSPLPAVKVELVDANALFPGKVLLDEQFRQASLVKSLRDERLNTLHLATHGQFGETVNDSFILTSDGRLNMDELANAIGQFKFRDQPLDLLVLSACETASGSARAALGLSGIAIKAGARSALGTLWKVDDEASAELMRKFYEILKGEPSLTRAQVLQRAQIALREDLIYANPGFWSPYILINSWL